MKKYQIHSQRGYIEGTKGTIIIQREEDILDLMEACYEYDIKKALLYDNNLLEDFFDLKTGFAGQIMQKLANYRFKAAFIIDQKYNTGKFADFVKESNLGKNFGFFNKKKQAEQWLATV